MTALLPSLQERGPPKTLSVQMSLSPQLLRMHPSLSDAMPVGGGKAGELLCCAVPCCVHRNACT